jgi:hypothetical protein
MLSGKETYIINYDELINSIQINEVDIKDKNNTMVPFSDLVKNRSMMVPILKNLTQRIVNGFPINDTHLLGINALDSTARLYEFGYEYLR